MQPRNAPLNPGTNRPPGRAPLLGIRGLQVTLPTARGEAHVVRQLDLSIGRGETVALIGESGCGKSMTALALMGLLPDGARLSGSMQLAPRDGCDGAPIELVGLPEPQWCGLRGARMAMVFQEPMTALNPLHTIGDQVAEPMRVHQGLSRAQARERAVGLLEAVRLPEARRRLDAWPHQLSGGQRQRVGIAMALACAPDLLIADEPTTALDVTLQKEVLGLLADAVRDRDMALLLISHDLDLVATSVEQVNVMYAGQVVETGPTAEVFSHLAHPYTRGLHGARPRIGLSRGRPLATIAGRVPEPTALPPGCSFSSRCGWALPACQQTFPTLDPAPGASPLHSVRCLRAAEVAGAAAPSGQPA